MQPNRSTENEALGSETPPKSPPSSFPSEILQAAIQQFYAEQVPPPEVLVSEALESEVLEALEAWLGSRAGRKVRVVVPQRGDKRGLLDLALRNAALSYDSHFGEGHRGAFEALETLRVVLDLPVLPRRIECFDISTLQGTNTVASKVVWSRRPDATRRVPQVRGARTRHRRLRVDGRSRAPALPQGAGTLPFFSRSWCSGGCGK